MSLSYSKLAACLALALAGGLAHADSTGAGAVTSVSYTLIDLDTNDGVTPSISFAASSGGYAGPYATGYVRAATPDDDTYREYTRQGAGPTSSINGGMSTIWSTASSSATGAAGIGFSSLEASGQAQSGDNISGVYYAMVTGPAAQFTLSPKTEVVFTVTGWLNGKTTLGGNPDTGSVESGGALLQLQTSGPTADGIGTVYDEPFASAVAWYQVADDGSVSGESQSWQGQLSSAYSNTTTGAVDGRFVAQLSASGYSVPATPVPEPSSCALILAGLTTVGGIARRRNIA